ncbi:hypothetical protein KIW84_013890 [Lathyrus oleraceus]|uniref:Reverse transcriptase zinc-binding domain-containing protein n=1 Tax=Pisum sativum TaxID=3888 RepID=A0A9D5BLB8_PEA|nr:hypothetical protein KIW84_013890 [Pisum sativum]
MWSKIWRLEVHDKLRCFMWLLGHDRLLTNFDKSLKSLGGAECRLCGSLKEDTMHVFRDYPKALQLWRNKILERCHILWFWRNKEDHDTQFHRPQKLGLYVKKRVNGYEEVMENNDVVKGGEKTVIWVGGWGEPLEESWVKLNTNGAPDVSKDSGCGGIIQNMYGMTNVELNVDSLDIVKMLESGGLSTTCGYTLIKQTYQPIEMHEEVRVMHSYMEANLCANALAKANVENIEEFIFSRGDLELY